MDISGLRVSTLDSHSFARLRIYPASGQFEIMAATRPIFCGAGWEEVGREAPGHSAPRRAESGDMERAQRRARRAVRDICLCNPMAYFCTLTIDAARLDRYDERAIWSKMRACWAIMCSGGGLSTSLSRSITRMARSIGTD